MSAELTRRRRPKTDEGLPGRTVVRRVSLPLVAAVLLVGGTASHTFGQPPSGPLPPDSPRLEIRGSGAHPADQAPPIPQLIANLGADAFATRDKAMQALAARGDEAFPYLVEALSDYSAERRQRVRRLLEQNDSFEQLAPHLLAIVSLPQGGAARELLLEFCLRQVELAGELTNVERLFRCWDTNRERYLADVLAAFRRARAPEDFRAIVQPLIDLRGKATRFSDAIARLDAMSVAHDHRHSPGFLVIQTLAAGLRRGRPELLAFATRYVESLESLVRGMSASGQSRHAIREEVANRAGWSQGAASFLAELLEPDSPCSRLVQEHIGIARTELEDGFFEGLGAADTRVYLTGVGRVHIVDLLISTFRQWPQAPGDGVVGQLKQQAVAAARAGDKPKALVLLEALEACRALEAAGLEVRTGLGSRFAERLLQGTQQATTHRDFHPVGSVHQRLVRLVQRGISPGHPAFPCEFAEQYFAGNPEMVSESGRLALERYLTLIDRLGALPVDWTRPGARRLAEVVRPHHQHDGDQLAKITQRVEDLARGPSAGRNPEAVDAQLEAWASELR